MDKHINILITSVGRRTYLVKWFREALQGYGKVYAANSTDLTPAFSAADGSMVTPPILSKHYIPTLLWFCRKQQITAVLPVFDADLPVLAAAREQFAAQGVRVIAAPPETLRVCSDKLAMFWYLREHSIQVPATCTVEELHRRYLRSMSTAMQGENFSSIGPSGSTGEGQPFQNQAGLGQSCGKRAAGVAQGCGKAPEFPMMVKPRFGMGSIGVEQARDLQELASALERTGERIRNTYLRGFGADFYRRKLCGGREENRVSGPDGDVILQEKVSGREFHLDVICDLEGGYCTTIVKEKLAMRSGETDAARITDLHSEEGQILGRLGRRLAELLPHPADLDVDVILTGKGEEAMAGSVPYVLDLNARFGGGYPFAHMAGANLPLAVVKWLAGENMPEELLCAVPGVVSMKSPMPVMVSYPELSRCSRRLPDPILYRLEGEKEIRAAVLDFGRYLDPPLVHRREFDPAVYTHKMAQRGIVLAAADQNGNMAGILCMYANAAGGESAWGTFLAVRPCVRGQGIGTRLFRAALRQAAFAGKKELRFLVHRSNPGAIRFYEGLGARMEEAGEECRRSPDRNEMIEMRAEV